jgi:hypothetical protein
VIAFMIDEYLGFVLKATKGVGVDDAVTITPIN